MSGYWSLELQWSVWNPDSGCNNYNAKNTSSFWWRVEIQHHEKCSFESLKGLDAESTTKRNLTCCSSLVVISCLNITSVHQFDPHLSEQQTQWSTVHTITVFYIKVRYSTLKENIVYSSICRAIIYRVEDWQ